MDIRKNIELKKIQLTVLFFAVSLIFLLWTSDLKAQGKASQMIVINPITFISGVANVEFIAAINDSSAFGLRALYVSTGFADVYSFGGCYRWHVYDSAPEGFYLGGGFDFFSFTEGSLSLPTLELGYILMSESGLTIGLFSYIGILDWPGSSDSVFWVLPDVLPRIELKIGLPL